MIAHRTLERKWLNLTSSRAHKALAPLWVHGVMVAAALLICSAGLARAQQRSAFRLTPIDTPTVFYFHSTVIDCQGLQTNASPSPRRS